MIKRLLWIRFACAAIAGGSSSLVDRCSHYPSRKFEDKDNVYETDLVLEDCDFAAIYADEMLERYERRWKAK